MIAADMFAGAGGWSLALRDLGYEERAFEIMPEARVTRRANGLDDSYGDVLNAPRGLIRTFSGLQVASPPCQTFSGAGKGEGRAMRPTG